MPGSGPEHGSEHRPAPKQTWRTAHGRMFATFFGLLSLVMTGLAALGLAAGPGIDGFRLVLTAGQAIAFGVLAWVHGRLRLEVDLAGVHRVMAGRSTSYPWEEITEIRPSIAKGRTTYLVLVQVDGTVVDLPVTEEILTELRRWQAAAAA